jgi:hypothetical protein
LSTLFEKSLALLQERIPELRGRLQISTQREPVQPPPGYPDRGESHTVQRVGLPAAPEAEYRFEFWAVVETLVYAIRATPQPPVEGGNYFWSMYGESYDFRSEEDYVEGICDFAVRLLTRPSRIVQRKRRRHWHFQCDILEDGRWVHLAWDSYRIGRLTPPPIFGSEHVYHAPALYPQYAGRWDPPRPRPGFACPIIFIGALVALTVLLERCA